MSVSLFPHREFECELKDFKDRKSGPSVAYANVDKMVKHASFHIAIPPEFFVLSLTKYALRYAAACVIEGRNYTRTLFSWKVDRHLNCKLKGLGR